MMTRLFVSALLVAGLSQAALAQGSTEPNQPSAEATQSRESLPQSIRQRLMSAGYNDVNVVPGSLMITARDNNGRPVMMRVTPNSMFLLSEIPAGGSSTTGTGRESPMAMENESAPPNQPSAQPNQPSAMAENTQAPQELPRSLRQRLAQARFSDVNIVPGSFVITARDSNGRPVMMRITPNSMFYLSEIPAGSSSTIGTGRGNPEESGQGR